MSTERSFQTGECDFLYGGADFKADLLESIAGDASLQAICTVTPLRRHKAGSRVGIRQIGGAVGFALILPCWLTDEVEKARSRSTGIAVIRRKDASYGYGFNAKLRTFNVTVPGGAGITSVGLAFVQSFDNDAVAISGVPDDAGQYNVPAGEHAFVVGADSITYSTANGAVPAGGFAIVGSAIVGEGVENA